MARVIYEPQYLAQTVSYMIHSVTGIQAHVRVENSLEDFKWLIRATVDETVFECKLDYECQDLYPVKSLITEIKLTI